MAPADPVYITIVRWPSELSLEDQVYAVSEAIGLDTFAAHQRIAKGVPAVIERVDAEAVPAIMRVFKERGVLALAVPERTLQGVAPAVLLKRIAPAIGAPEPMFLFEPWRGEATGVLAADLFLLIRARISALIRGETQTDQYMSVGYFPGVGVTVAPVSETYRYDRTRLTQVIDIYTRDGRAFRVLGTKFNFEGLGKQRGLTDGENADKLACLLGESSPACQIDTEFDRFSCPQAFYHNWRRTTNKAEIRSDESAFEFYSPWRFLLTKARTRKKG